MESNGGKTIFISLFARKVEQALEYGVECLEQCFDHVPESVARVMHMCCDYPGYIDKGRLIAVPDCGLMMYDREMAVA